ncbi:MAG: hypothetical protein HY744_22950 [Deltaproteobacteria bacterium]|nr:hypothetical protein [Deltaproteobacteria bacterium]
MIEELLDPRLESEEAVHSPGLDIAVVERKRGKANQGRLIDGRLIDVDAPDAFGVVWSDGATFGISCFSQQELAQWNPRLSDRVEAALAGREPVSTIDGALRGLPESGAGASRLEALRVAVRVLHAWVYPHLAEPATLAALLERAAMTPYQFATLLQGVSFGDAWNDLEHAGSTAEYFTLVQMREFKTRSASILDAAESGQAFRLAARRTVKAELVAYDAAKHGVVDTITRAELRRHIGSCLARVREGKPVRVTRGKISVAQRGVVLLPPAVARTRRMSATERRLLEGRQRRRRSREENRDQAKHDRLQRLRRERALPAETIARLLLVDGLTLDELTALVKVGGSAGVAGGQVTDGRGGEPTT